MPLGAILGALPAVGGIVSGIGGIVNSITGRGRRRSASAESASTGSNVSAMASPEQSSVPVPAAPAAPAAPPRQVFSSPPGPLPGQQSSVPVPADYFDNTGQGIGAGIGAVVGSRFGPIGTAIGAGVGGQLGEAIGQRIQVPGSRQPTASVVGQAGLPPDVLTLLSSGGGRSGRRTLAAYLLASGQLAAAGIVRPPLVFTASNGQVKYGSDLGFVLVTRRVNNQEVKFQCEKTFARTLGWYRPRRKPVISVRDSNAIRRAKRARDRVYKLAKDSELCVTKRSSCAPRRKSTSGRRTSR